MRDVTGFECYVRPVICHSGNNEHPYFFYGSGFLVCSEVGFYFVTARHVISNHGRRMSDLRILARFGSDDTMPWGEGINGSTGENNSYDDLLLVHLDRRYIQSNYLTNQFWPLRYRPDFVKLGFAAFAIVYPQDEQDEQIETNIGFYGASASSGIISALDPEERTFDVETFPQNPLNSFNQMSGGAVFSYDPNRPDDIHLSGVILQGGRDTNKIVALDSLCIFNLIHFYERDPERPRFDWE